MSDVIEQIRNVCALGALQSVTAIERAIPIIHAGPGCGQKLWSALSSGNGFQGSGYAGGHSVPCSNSTENEIVFGGEDKLRETIENSLKVMDGDLFVVLTGCTADIVGDDTGDVVRQFKNNGVPIVHVETGGFKGNNYFGHELLWEALIEQLLEDPEEVQPGLVNVWSVLPYQDPFWAATLETIGRLLSQIGLTPNLIYGQGQGIASVRRIPSAQFNLLLTPWLGLKTVKHLEERFATPYFQYPALPVGATESSRFLRAVAAYADIDSNVVEAVIEREEKRYYYYMERAADLFFETRFKPGHFITIADSGFALGLSRFLVNDLGLIPEAQFVTDKVPDEHKEKIEAEFNDSVAGIPSPVIFTTDGGTIREVIKGLKFRERPLILGSTWDKVITRELQGYPLSISLPVSDRLVLNRTYAGYDGGLTLAEDIYTIILNSFQ